MMNLRNGQWALVLCIFLFFCPALPGAGEEAVKPDRLVSSVRELGLGEGAFVVGASLTPDQIEQALASPMDDAYAGTIKFSSGNFVVVADEKTHMVLAVYQRQEGIMADDVTQMIGYLMNRFGEPTTMAHGKLIYWAYGENGKIDGDTYAGSKATGKIDILATVKFSSTLDLTPGMEGDTEETGTIYYIITSDRLLNEFVNQP
jgi:hypothetical protein